MSRRTAAYQATAAVITLLSLVAVMHRTSGAVLSATTNNNGNIWEISNLTITHAPAATLFTLDAANNGPLSVPSSGGPACVDVTVNSTGNPGQVRLYVANVINTDGAANSGDDAKLSDDLELQVVLYPAGETCASKTVGSTAKAFTVVDAYGVSYADPQSATLWDPGKGTDATRAVEISWRLQDTTNAEKEGMKGDRVALDLIWEVQE